MAEKVKFCRKCGAPRTEGAKFCKRCGYQFGTGVSTTPTQTEKIQEQYVSEQIQPVYIQVEPAATPVEPASAAEKSKGEPVKPKRTSIAPMVHNASKMAPDVISKVSGAAASVPGVSAVAKKAGQMVNMPGVSDIAQQAGQMINLQEVSALAQPGEFVLDDFVLGALDDVAGSEAGEILNDIKDSITDTISDIKSPLSTALGGAGSVFTGIFKSFKQPKVLLTSALMAVLWIFLGTQRNSDSEVVKILSFLTFSEGGFDREGLGTLGGIAGKGAVAVMFGSLLSGGIPKLISGIGSLFKKTAGKKSIVALLVGIILGIIIYFAFTGLDIASAATAMAGISGAALSLEALGGKNGWIYQMAASLTAKKVDGVRTLQDGKINSLLGGLTAGFAIVTAVTSMW
jgi:hypothetical protein